MSSEDVVAAESKNRLNDHFNRTARYNPTRSLTALTGQLSQEYEDRFLIELVQNAYDAQVPGTSDGSVHVRLDEAAPNGPVLYVANTGLPFTESNFDALTNVAQSSKPPGEGIGNKGVGFRSVLQVCDSPEIYSCDIDDLTSVGFGGFCFGFATDDQIRAMVRNEDEFAIVKQDFSRYLLPVVMFPSDPFLIALRAMEMVTVVRLPLQTPRAVELAREQVKRLLEPSPPIALFLDRLRSIVVEHVDAEGEVERAEVDRNVEVVFTADSGLRLQWITTVGRRYLTTTRTLDASAVREVVRMAVADGQLDSAWAEWHSDVDVSLAIPFGIDELDPHPVSYTYLPMRVPSPVHAFLHAPFHTKMARLDLSQRSLFNDFLIGVAAGLAAETVQLLVAGEQIDLDAGVRRAAVADLLTWDDDHAHCLVGALKQIGLDLGSSPLIPARGPDGSSWASLDTVRVWRSPGLTIVSSEAIEHYALVLDESLGDLRVERMKELARQHLGHVLEPSDAEVAEWIEQIAAGLKRGVTQWNRFLSDVAVVFENRRVSALQGRSILLDDNLNLRRTGPWPSAEVSSTEPTVFIPPFAGSLRSKVVDDDADLSSVPKNLQRGFAFLHHGISVRARAGSTNRRTPVGELLQQAGLVEPFELASILGHLKRMLSGRVSDTTHRQALSWVYAQERASRSNVADLHELALRVPTFDGWIPADRAVFSEAWGTRRGPSLARLVETAGQISPSIQAVGDRAILVPDSWPFRIKDLDSLREFLVRCGVKDGLFPAPLRSRNAVRMDGANFTADSIADRFGLYRRSAWAQQISVAWRPIVEGRYTTYTGDQELWVVPGQDEVGSLGSAARDLLAAAILESMADWPENVWSYGFRRLSQHHRHRPDPQIWPSPARSFIETDDWFPMADAGRRDDRYFVPVCDGWSFDETSSEVAPRFARLAPVDHRRRLAASPAAQHRLTRIGLRTWNTPASARHRLDELGALVSSESVADGELLSVRRAVRDAWSEHVGLPAEGRTQPRLLVVSRGNVMAAVEPSGARPPEVFVHDVQQGLAAQILEALELPILVSDPADGDQIASLLGSMDGISVRRTSEVVAIVKLDSAELSPSADTGDAFLDQFGPWVIRTLLAIIDLRSTRFVRVTDKVLHDVEAALRRMRLATGSHIELMVDGQTLLAGGRLSECVHVDDLDHPLLVLNRTGIPVPSWRALEVIADDLADLLRQTVAASEIRAAALAFQRTVGDWREPSDGEIAEVLRCSVQSVTEVLRNLRTTTDHVRLLVSPVVGVLGGIEAARRVESEPADDVDDLGRLLAELIGADRGSLLLNSALKSESIADVRRSLDIELGPLNSVLEELGRQPLHFEDLHEAALSSYLNDHRLELLDELRRRYFGQFEGLADLSAFAYARDFNSVVLDSSWLSDHEVPADAMLSALLCDWLALHGTDANPGQLLEDVDAVRELNGATLDRLLPTVRRVTAAWLQKHDRTAQVSSLDVAVVRETLSLSGCLDFAPLSDGQVLAWLTELGIWPEGMLPSVDIVCLGLTPEDLDTAAASARKAADLLDAAGRNSTSEIAPSILQLTSYET